MIEKKEYEFELTKGEVEAILIEHFMSIDKIPEYIHEDSNSYVSSRITPQQTIVLHVRNKKGELPDE